MAEVRGSLHLYHGCKRGSSYRILMEVGISWIYFFKLRRTPTGLETRRSAQHPAVFYLTKCYYI